MKRYKVIIAYDGTNYAGWQVQPKKTAVANKLEDAFYYAFKKKIRLIGASRTDAGVHAIGQVAMFDVELDLPVQRIQKVWNDVLPPTIVLHNLEHVADTFHARYGVAYKIYTYRIFLTRPLPFIERYGYYFPTAINSEKLQQALALFEGTHDFSAFSSSEPYKNPVRTLESITIAYDALMHECIITFKGKSFLRYMIRRIVGACLQIASKKNMSIELLQQALLSKNSQQQLYNAPAQGLMLHEIVYKQNGDL